MTKKVNISDELTRDFPAQTSTHSRSICPDLVAGQVVINSPSEAQSRQDGLVQTMEDGGWLSIVIVLLAIPPLLRSLNASPNYSGKEKAAAKKDVTYWTTHRMGRLYIIS